MPQSIRKLAPGELVIGFMTIDGALIGELVEPDIGHEELSLSVEGLRAKLATGQVIGITIGKSPAGDVRVFGSGRFPPPYGVPLSIRLRDLARKLVE